MQVLFHVVDAIQFLNNFAGLEFGKNRGKASLALSWMLLSFSGHQGQFENFIQLLFWSFK
jgi:hypothetical protein